MSEPTLSQRVRLHIYEFFLEHERAPVVEELMGNFGLTRAETVAVIQELIATRNVAVVKGTARILMAWPFSGVTTPFVAKARGKTYMTNCAWDSIALHAMLHDEPVDVELFCHHCARPIRIELRDGRAVVVEPQTTLVFLALPPTQWWEDIIYACSNTMVFFCSAEHRDASGLDTNPELSASLTPDEMHQLSVLLYDRRLQLDYVRPGPDELNAHFTSLGLTGEYWRI